VKVDLGFPYIENEASTARSLTARAPCWRFLVREMALIAAALAVFLGNERQAVPGQVHDAGLYNRRRDRLKAFEPI
jgi:hypothetical protein